MTKKFIDNKYEILKILGKGGMSTVYLAMDVRLNKQWAIKEILKENSQLSQVSIVEANLLKKLDHPALPRIVDIIDDNDFIYIIMDYIEGESLDRVLKDYGAQNEALVLDWAKQIASVLHYLHEQQPPIIYRDMKPANIILTPSGVIKVIDFGIAREYKQENSEDTTILGTKGYAPPEQYGQRQTDGRTDIYALGMTLHHLLTNIDPRQIDYQYVPIRLINEQLSISTEQIIDKCTALNPEERYQTALELLYDLEHPELVMKTAQKQRKIKIFIGSVVLTITLGICSICMFIIGTHIQNNQYETLIHTVSALSFEEKLQKYEKAIMVYPNKVDAYHLILQSFIDKGSFTKKDSDLFLSLYNANKKSFPNDSAFAKLNYQAAQLYLNVYESDIQDKIQKSFPFLDKNKEMDLVYDEKSMSELYYDIVFFYKKYILSSATIVEVTQDDLQQLINKIKNIIDDSEKINMYDKLLFYHTIYLFLFDQRLLFVHLNISQHKILDMIETIYSQTENMTVLKGKTKQIKQNILDQYPLLKNVVKRTYNITERGT